MSCCLSRVPAFALCAGALIILGSITAACSSEEASSSQQPAAGGASGGDTGGSAGWAAGNGGAAGSTAGSAGSAGSTAGAAGQSSQGGSGQGGAAGAGVVPIEQLTDKASAAVCGALFRCCNQEDLKQYFFFYAEDESLKDAGYAEKIPPKASLDEPGCKAILEEMMDRVPFGDWVAAVQAGSVQYNPSAAQTCLQALETATCGQQVTEALFDSTCFYVSAPVGPEQRKLFTRTASGAADECTPIRDGTGARFYGTCDPSKSFCCYDNPDNPENVCAFPFDAEGKARKGHCKPASLAGEGCSGGLATVQLCVTGQDCDFDTSKCVAPASGELNVGDTCIDDSFHLLGTCKDSWCDQLDTSKCVPYEPDGSDCAFPYECVSGACNEGKCGAPKTCSTTL